MAQAIEIPNVTQEQATRLRAVLGNDPLSGFDADEGTVRGDCVEVGYRYDPGSGLLTLEPVKLPEHLQDEDGSALRKMIQIGLDASLALPSKCGIYDYVLITLDNQSGQTLTYSTANITSGTVTVQAQSVPTGQSLLAIQGESRKGSIVGAVADVVFTFADGITTLNINYALYSSSDASYSAGLAGANTPSFKVTNATTGATMDGYTYMQPTTTISPA